MRFKLDENLPGSAAAFLHESGHDVSTALEEGLSGASDSSLLRAAESEERALITLDVGFGDLRLYPPGSHSGIIVLRPRNQSRERIVEILQRLQNAQQAEPISGQLWIVDEHRIRIRESSES